MRITLIADQADLRFQGEAGVYAGSQEPAAK
jgi:hypothetical protein